MGRIFTYGCSFTSHIWPTWADLLLHNNHGYNFGNQGSGVVQIMNKIIYTDTVMKFTENDIVIVVLPTIHRWDFITGENSIWSTDGRIDNNIDFDLTNEKYYTLDGLEYLNKNAAIIIENFLKSKNLKYFIGGLNNTFENIVNCELINFSSYLYNDDYGKSWVMTKRWIESTDFHPRTIQHYKWLNDVLMKKLIGIDLNVTMDDVNLIEKKIDELDSTRNCFSYFKTKTEYFKNKMSNKIYFNI